MFRPATRCHHVSPAAKNLPPEVAANVPATSSTPKSTGKETALRKARRTQTRSVGPADAGAEGTFVPIIAQDHTLKYYCGEYYFIVTQKRLQSAVDGTRAENVSKLTRRGRRKEEI